MSCERCCTAAVVQPLEHGCWSAARITKAGNGAKDDLGVTDHDKGKERSKMEAGNGSWCRTTTEDEANRQWAVTGDKASR